MQEPSVDYPSVTHWLVTDLISYFNQSCPAERLLSQNSAKESSVMIGIAVQYFVSSIYGLFSVFLIIKHFNLDSCRKCLKKSPVALATR